MITQVSVLNTIQNNGADVSLDNSNNLNIKGLLTMPGNSWRKDGIIKIPYLAEQIQKTRLTFTSSNSTTYQLSILGASIQYGTEKTLVINWTSTASNTTALTSAAIAALINAYPDFTVSATDTGSGVVDLAGHATIYVQPQAPVGPTFTVLTADTKCTISAPLTVTFAAPPTGGRIATGFVVVPDSGTLSTVVNTAVVITDGGEGYTAAPTMTFAGGDGSSAAATAIIFQGRVVGAKASAGASYTTRIGILPQGTYDAIRAKYAYVTPGPNDPGVPALSALSSLVAGNTYDEWDFSYNDIVVSGNTTTSSTVATAQQELFVYTGYATVTTTGSCADVLTLNSYWGVLANLKHGYKSNIIDSVASNVIDSATAATGAFVLIAGGSPALGAVSLGMKNNDVVAMGTAAPIVADGTGVYSIATITDNLNGFFQFGMSSIAADSAANTVYKYVKLSNITN